MEKLADVMRIRVIRKNPRHAGRTRRAPPRAQAVLESPKEW
jgi:hypothetical protein